MKCLGKRLWFLESFWKRKPLMVTVVFMRTELFFFFFSLIMGSAKTLGKCKPIHKSWAVWLHHRGCCHSDTFLQGNDPCHGCIKFLFHFYGLESKEFKDWISSESFPTNWKMIKIDKMTLDYDLMILFFIFLIRHLNLAFLYL